jgi:RNA polymerase sigma-70 factor (ECF subfamily)
MSEESGFQDLIQRVRAGDERAAAELMQRYKPFVCRAARLGLQGSCLRRLYDPLDVCQSVFASFFIRLRAGQYELKTPGQLLRLLLALSRHKLADHLREQLAARRDLRRLRSAGRGLSQLPAAEADPSQEVAAAELVVEVQRRLSAEERWLAEQRAAGRPWEEVAAERGGSPEALRKQLARAIERVLRELDLDEFSHD